MLLRDQFHGCVFPTLMMILAALPASRVRADDAAAKRPTIALSDDYPKATLPTAAGCELSLAASRGRVATVIMCMSVECPISNEYLPAIQRVADGYRQRGVNLIGINPNGAETLAAMSTFAREHKLAFPFAKDVDGKVSRQLHFSVTPEACVFDTQGQIVYRGRIDDRYRAGGGKFGAKSTPELTLALDDLLAGKPVRHARTKPVGCPIQLAAPPAGQE